MGHGSARALSYQHFITWKHMPSECRTPRRMPSDGLVIHEARESRTGVVEERSARRRATPKGVHRRHTARLAGPIIRWSPSQTVDRGPEARLRPALAAVDFDASQERWREGPRSRFQRLKPRQRVMTDWVLKEQRASFVEPS